MTARSDKADTGIRLELIIFCNTMTKCFILSFFFFFYNSLIKRLALFSVLVPFFNYAVAAINMLYSY